MRLDKLKNQLELIQLLVDRTDFSIEELCEKLDISRRNLYYLISFLDAQDLLFLRIKDIII